MTELDASGKPCAGVPRARARTSTADDPVDDFSGADCISTADVEQRAHPPELVAEERFRQLVESVHDYALFMLDTLGHVVTWNPGAERLKGYRAGEIIGRHFSVFYPDDGRRDERCHGELVQAAREGRFEEEGWRVRADGSQFWANVVINAIRDANGQVIGFTKITRDLTDRKRADEERTARLAAEAANRAKDEFLAILGHELRNPLAPIVTAVDILKHRSGERDARELEIIERQLQHVTRLVDDLLDVARIVQGKIEVRRESLDIGDVVTRAIEQARALLEHRGHRLTVELPRDPVHVEGDQARLVQVVGNLLVNSAKYTEPGGNIAIDVRDLAGRVAIEVRDDGIGIAPDLMPRVFDLFAQGDHEAPARGLGLGLALVRRLVELHGGTVEAHSDGPRRGSTFVVDLPTVPPPPHVERRGAARTRVTRPRRVMIVDDHVDAAMLLGDALALAGHEVRTVNSPEDAIETVRTFHPDVAILDIGMPGMDGYELARTLRERLGDTKLKLIALTGYGQPSDRERSAAAGFDAHFVKPVDLRHLHEDIAKA
jgi:PAS domain S-box-containing protein